MASGSGLTAAVGHRLVDRGEPMVVGPSAGQRDFEPLFDYGLRFPAFHSSASM